MSLQLSLFHQLPESQFDTASASFVDKKSKVIKRSVAEYFAGIGLVRLGLEQAGWNVVFANDIAPSKYEMYASYFQDAQEHYKVEDIFELDPSSIPETTLATSSFPCIDLSLAGNQNGLAGKHSSAFWGVIRILREQKAKKPPVVMLENVPGWLTSNKGADFRLTIQALNDLGYSCDVFALDAIRFTAQSRLRIFVIGMQTGPKNNVSRLLWRSDAIAPKTLKDAIKVNLDLDWHFRFLPSPPQKRSSGLSSIIEKMEDSDSRWWNPAEVDRHLKMMAPSHRETIHELASQPVVSYRTVYRRRRNGQQRAEVRNDDTAGCLRTARGGSSRQIVVEVGNGDVRMRHMTPREYARLQGVPDDYPLPQNNIQALTGFGDAVCVPVIKWIAEMVLNPLIIEQF